MKREFASQKPEARLGKKGPSLALDFPTTFTFDITPIATVSR